MIKGAITLTRASVGYKGRQLYKSLKPIINAHPKDNVRGNTGKIIL